MKIKMRVVTSLTKWNQVPKSSQFLLPVGTNVEESEKLLQLRPRKLPPLPRTRDLLHVYGITAKKHMSQNFLLNQKLLRSLVRAAGIMPGHRVIEIGPGPGNLTRAILEQSPFEVLAIEKDRRFLPLLEQLADSVLPGQLKILLGDALDHDLDDIFGDPINLLAEYNLPDNIPGYLFNFPRDWEDKQAPLIRVVGNLPFSISTILLVRYLQKIAERRSFWKYGRVPMLFTFQDEVARRITARPASSEWTRLSAMSQNYCYVDYKFRILGNSFTPKALVDTGVVRFYPRKQAVCQVPFKLYEKFIRHLFHHRNRTVGYNFSNLFPVDMRELSMKSFSKAEVTPEIYPSMIGIHEIGRLCDEYYALCQKIPPLIDFDYRASKKKLPELEESVMACLRLLK